MVLCKFFLQGYCKFGDYCKFEHQVNENCNSYQNQQSTSILRKANFESSQVPKQNVPVVQDKSSNVDTGTLVKSVVNDMTSVEKGGQWLLSCYAPFKEKPQFPGFEDQSFEEVRFGYYEAANNGTMQQYTQQIQFLLQQAVTKIKALQNPSPDIVNMLKSIYDSPPSSHYGLSSGTINATPPQQTSNINQQSAAIFTQPNNLFNNPQQQQTPFGTSGSIFGGQVTSSVTTPSSGSIFAVPPSTAQQNPQSTAFSPQASVFSTQSTGNFAQNVLGAAPQVTGVSSSIFPNSQTLAAPASSTSIFSAPVSGGGNFNVNQVSSSSSMFNQPIGLVQNSNSILQQQNIQAHSANIFGGTQSVFKQPSQPVDETLYSKKEDLTEDEIKFFESEEWDISKVPEKPPTYEMCFKAS